MFKAFLLLCWVYGSNNFDEAIIKDLDLYMDLEYVEDESTANLDKINDEELDKTIKSSKEDK